MSTINPHGPREPMDDKEYRDDLARSRFGSRIRKRRLALNLTQMELAELADGNLSGATISNVEIGRVYPRQSTRRTILGVLRELEGEQKTDEPEAVEAPVVEAQVVEAKGLGCPEGEVESFIATAIRLISEDSLKMSSLGFTICIGNREISLDVRTAH